MTVWYKTARQASWPARLVVAAGILAVVFILAVPAAFFVGLILVILGHVLAGLALFGASVLAAVAAVAALSVSGVQYVRRLVNKLNYQAATESDRPDLRVVQLDQSEYDYR